MDLLAIWLGKLTLVALRVVGRRATALPGLVVEKAFPGFLTRRLTRLAQGVVVVSGTNGKTTTTKMVATILGQRYRVLTNDTGGNFVRGTITAVLEDCSWRGRSTADVAVFELDEAHAVRFCQVYPPQRLLLLNVLRDQLDRFGEIDTTAHILSKVARATTGHVVLNRDDPRLVQIAERLSGGVSLDGSDGGVSGEGSDGGLSGASPGPVVSYFGVAHELRAQFPTDEELYGGAVGYSDLPTTAELLSVHLALTTEMKLRIAQTVEDISLRAEGAHNAQNAAAAAALALTFGLDADTIAGGLRSVEPAFGRGQSFDVSGRRIVLQLVKNPAGFRLSLRTIDGLSPAAIVIAINDDYADGRDMSWLWDVDFAPVSRDEAAWLVTSGTRAADMALRLHYDGIAANLVERDLAAAVTHASLHVKAGDTVVVFSTYTAMWELHQVLEKLSTRPAPNSRAAT